MLGTPHKSQSPDKTFRMICGGFICLYPTIAVVVVHRIDVECEVEFANGFVRDDPVIDGKEFERNTHQVPARVLSSSSNS